jgi:hypothetical protein
MSGEMSVFIGRIVRQKACDGIRIVPVFYEFEDLAVPTLLIIGDRDNTAIGKDFAPPAVQPTLGHYPELAKAAAMRIRGNPRLNTG